MRENPSGQESGKKTAIHTDQAPAAIGPYSQAIQVFNNSLIFVSGQIPLVPETMELVAGGITEQAVQVMKNLQAVCAAAGGGLDDIVKLTIYMTELSEFAQVNQVMEDFFDQPYPARATVGISALPKNARVEIEAVMTVTIPDN